MRRRTTLTAILALVFMVGLLAGPALADNNSLRAQAELADVTVTTTELDGIPYAAVRHDLDYERYVWCEPVRLGGAAECFEGTDSFHTLYLGITEAPHQPVHHTGQVSVYYETDDGWKAIIAQFNGKGELLRVNGERL